MSGVRAILAKHWQLRRILIAATRVEVRKKYAGSILGPTWAVLYPLLFLGAYLFLSVVVLRARFATTGAGMDYVLFVFSGLVPYLFFSEAINSGVVAIRQNVHLVKGAIMPLELLPTRAVLVACTGHLVSLFVVIALAAATGNISLRLVWLPIVVAIQTVWLGGLCLILAPVGVIVPDIAPLVALGTTFLMFVSPIAFPSSMVPTQVRFITWLNPLTYMTDAYRTVLVVTQPVDRATLFGFVMFALLSLVAGSTFCWRFKGVVADLE